jgi:hypothetical protein
MLVVPQPILDLKFLILPTRSLFYVLCKKEGISYHVLIERVIYNILDLVYNNPNTHMDHFIYQHRFASCLNRDILLYTRPLRKTSLEIFIGNLQPCYTSWVQSVWKESFSDNIIIHVSPLFCTFLSLLLQYPEYF